MRIDFGRATVFGTNPSAKNKQTGRKEELLNATGWTNYMYAYSIGKDSEVTPYYGEAPTQMGPESYTTGLFGGADQARIMQWNLQSTRAQKMAEKRRLIAQVNPLIAILNEPRQEHEYNNYNTITSLPAPGAQHKRNCSLLTHRSLHLK